MLSSASLKLLLLLANAITGFIVAKDPAKITPPSPGERLKVSGWEHWFPVIVIVLRAGTVILPICEIVTLLTLYYRRGTMYHNVTSAILSSATLSNASKLSVTPAFLILSGVSLLAALYRRHCFAVLGRHFTFDLAIRKNHKLITSGPYSIVRHPSYTCALNARKWETRFGEMEKEDEMLRNEFGKEWELWKEAVPYKLFPVISNLPLPLPFQLKLAIISE
ncbi:hypothetical protein ONZ45_g8690 [Pleurotus djamor]|nr:hypothetical protein ONZ45_g8690 [Pleurotus djamor]